MAHSVGEQHSGFQAIKNYPNMRGLFSPPRPTKPRQTGHQRSESFEFCTELEKLARELKEDESNDKKPVHNGNGSKRGRASPEPEDDSIASPAKKQKAEVKAEPDVYSIWDAMVCGPSFPGTTESSSRSSPRKARRALPDIGSILAAKSTNPKRTIRKRTIPKSRKFKIFEDPDAGTDDYRMVGREVPWVPEYADENKENIPPEFEVGVEEANVVSEYQDFHYPSWSRRLPREILGELQHN